MEEYMQSILPKTPERALYPISEARELLGNISHTGIYEIIKRGDLKIVKVGSRSFVTNTEIRRFVAELEAANAS